MTSIQIIMLLLFCSCCAYLLGRWDGFVFGQIDILDWMKTRSKEIADDAVKKKCVEILDGKITSKDLRDIADRMDKGLC